MRVVIALVLLVLGMGIQLELYKIQERFRQNRENGTALLLPVLIKESTIQEEIEHYSSLHQSGTFANFKADPELSAKILMKQGGTQSQSLYFMGRQVSHLLIELTITSKGDPSKHIPDCIQVYLINRETNQILMAKKVRQIFAAKIELVSQLYELRIVHSWPKDSNPADEQAAKHITISMDVIGGGTIANNTDDGGNAAEKVMRIEDETDRVFLSSLQIWQQISRQAEVHYSNQENVYLRAYFELMLVFAINCIEIMLMRRTLKLKSLI